jgi:hypothetical protein
VGTRGQFATQRSGATVEGGPGLLDSVLDVPRDNVPEGVDCRRVLSVHVDLLEPALLGEHVGELVLEGVPVGVDYRRVLSVQLLHVSLLELALHDEHLRELVLGPSFLLLISLH